MDPAETIALDALHRIAGRTEGWAVPGERWRLPHEVAQAALDAIDLLRLRATAAPSPVSQGTEGEEPRCGFCRRIMPRDHLRVWEPSGELICRDEHATACAAEAVRLGDAPAPSPASTPGTANGGGR